MLEYLRNAADKPLAKVLMFILIFSFVGWGAAEWIFGGASRDTTLIHVGNADISVQQFSNERSRELASMSKDEQRATYADPAKAAELTQSVMTTLTMNQLALNRANDLGFVVTDKRIADEIKNNPQFQVNGQFVPWMFDMVVQNSGLSEQDIANLLRNNVLRQMVVGASYVPLNIPEFAVDAMYNARHAKRDIKYLTVKFSDSKVSEPNEEQLKTFYAQHPKVLPETRSVSYVFVAADMNKPDVYDEGFKLAQQIEDMIISGESMKDAADKYKAKFVVVPDVTLGGKISDKILSDGLVAKVFSMDAGMESELIELKDGFVILRVDSVNAERNADFKDVKKDLVNQWKKAEQRKNAYVAANEFLTKAKNGENFKNMKSVTISRTEGAPLEILNAAFSGRVGDTVIVEDDNAFYVLSIEKSIAPKPNDKDRDAIRKDIKKISERYVGDDYSQFLKRHYPVRVNDKNYKKFVAK